MSRLSLLLLIAILLVNLNCSSSPTATEELVENVNVKGLVFDVFDKDTLPLSAISIVLNDSTLFSNSQGIFNLGSLKEGSYELSFLSELHEPLDTLINVLNTDSIDLSIQLIPIYLDFAPLFEGSEWVYELKANSRSWSVTGGQNGSAYESQSTLKINVISLIEKQNEFEYQINLQREGYYTEVSNSDSVTTNFSSTGSYKVIEDRKTNILSIIDLVQEGYWYGGTFYLTPFTFREHDFVITISQNNSCCGWDYVQFRRYFPISRLPDQNLFSLSHNVVHKPDSGLVFFGESYGGHTGSGSTSQKLISVSKRN